MVTNCLTANIRLVSTENRPYWFDMTVLEDISSRVKEIKKSLEDTVTWLERVPSANDIAERFTGVSLVSKTI